MKYWDLKNWLKFPPRIWTYYSLGAKARERETFKNWTGWWNISRWTVKTFLSQKRNTHVIYYFNPLFRVFHICHLEFTAIVHRSLERVGSFLKIFQKGSSGLILISSRIFSPNKNKKTKNYKCFKNLKPLSPKVWKNLWPY